MKNETINKIIEELNLVTQLMHKFSDTGKMPDIERDIVLSKLRNAYGFIQLIEPEPPEISKLIKSKEQEQLISPHSSKPIENSFVSAEEQPQKEELVTIKPKVAATMHQEPFEKKEILAETFKSQGFLNEALAQFGNLSDLSKKMQNQPLNDIFSAINLNDKFLFIKVLFDNDSSAYQTTIEQLNSSADFNEAVRYLDAQFKWDFNNNLVQKLLELVRRRYL